MEQRAFIVSGASSGIGLATAELLARDGFVTFAGVRSAADAQRLEALHPNLRPLLLDVTRPDQIEAAAARVAQSGLRPAGLVNNAGIAVAGPLEYLPPEELRRSFEVNVLGALRLTQAFLGALRAARGRLVFVGSISGRFAVPFLGPYCASKFALRALADALRMELARAGVAVSLIEPGSVRTPIWAKGRASKAELIARLPDDAPPVYRVAVDAIVAQTEHEERAGIDAGRVARAIRHALTARRPAAYYVVGGRARARSFLSFLPPALADRLVLGALRL